MTLYEITEEIQILERLIEEAHQDADGAPREPTETERETLLAYIEEMDGKFSQKAENICRFMRTQEELAQACKEEETRLERLRKSRERKAFALKNLLQFSMERAGMEKAEAGTFRLNIQKNPPSVVIGDETRIPENLFRVIPETRTPDKKLIADALKSGEEISGAWLVQTKGLRVK